jgi:hypothetical protein
VPIDPPNYRALQLDSSLIDHDIFEHIEPRLRDLNWLNCLNRYNSYASTTANPVDLQESNQFRNGIYLHWSLPAAYRTGITASSSADKSHAARKLRQGFPSDNSDSASAPETMPTFRPVADQWLILRHLRNGSYGARGPGNVGFLDGMSEQYKLFVVESNLVRGINSIPPMEDIDATASPYFDPHMPLDRQGKSFLGQTFRLSDWQGDTSGAPLDHNHVPLTVLRTANPYFADYQLHNSSVFSFYDDLTIKPGDHGFKSDNLLYITDGEISYTVIGYHSVPSRDPLSIN